MNIALWVLQVLLALHTATGAVWKLGNSEQTVPSLSAIPHALWLGLTVIELLCAIALLLPAIYRPAAFLVPLAAIVIAAEMLMFCGVHLASGDRTWNQMIYWIVVACICAFITWSRLALRPL